MPRANIGRAPSAKSTARSRCLLAASLLLPLSACSTLRSPPPVLPLPANLAAVCEAMPVTPKPFVDPDRLIWEIEVASRYQDCATRHRLTVEAWRAVSEKDRSR